MEYTKEQKIELFNKLPETLKNIITSTELPEKIQSISDKYDLMLDNYSVLSNEIVLLILGATSQKDFVSNISNKMNMGTDICTNIAKDVNDQILNDIKSDLRESREPATDSIIFNESEISPLPDKQPATSSYSIPTKKPNPVVTSIPTYTHPPEITKDIPNIEKVGNFKIEESTPSIVENKSQEISKDEVLKGIEEPEKLEQVSMIDHLLTTPISNKEKIIDKKVEVKEYKTDPYRESL